jgi:uncharacterized protein (DUF58 family)
MSCVAPSTGYPPPAGVDVVTADSVEAELSKPTRDGRFDAYLLLAIGGFVTAMLRGRPEPAVLATPFAIALALGVRGSRTIRLAWRVEVSSLSIIEGDRVRGEVIIDRPEALALEVTLMGHDALDAIAPETSLSWRVASGTGEVRLAFTVTGQRWGRHGLGTLVVRARRPFGLFRWESEIGQGPDIRVLPTVEHLRRLLDPASSRAAWGVHRSRLVGTGTEFAEVRPYHPGDRLRDLNWRATARLREPHVNRHHVERAGEVVLLIDTSTDAVRDASEIGQAALARSARAAWALASVHLAAHDRVGLLTHGEVSTWLSPNSGDRARYQLLETLLGVGGDVAARRHRFATPADRMVPPSALVVAVTPLWNGRIVTTLQALRAKGRPVAAVIVDMSDAFPSDAEHERQAQRLFNQLVEARAAALHVSGVPTVAWAEGQPMAGLVRTLQLVEARSRVGAAR